MAEISKALEESLRRSREFLLASQARKRAEAEAKKPKLASVAEPSEAVLRANADRALDRLMEAERRDSYEARRQAQLDKEWEEQRTNPRLRYQRKIDAWVETRRRIEAHERWLKRPGIRLDIYGNEIDYNPIRAWEDETRD
jgi:hypothetical protein